MHILQHAQIFLLAGTVSNGTLRDEVLMRLV